MSNYGLTRVRYIEEKPAPKWGGTPKKDKGKGTFDVQEVLDHRSCPDAGKGHGKMQYLVVWEPVGDDCEWKDKKMWELASNIPEENEPLQVYLRCEKKRRELEEKEERERDAALLESAEYERTNRSMEEE
jgi:hypothetical protein